MKASIATAMKQLCKNKLIFIMNIGLNNAK